MQFREGDKVAYIGPEVEGRRVGDEGRVISSEGEASHVAWTSGQHHGALALVPAYDLTPVVESREASYEHGHLMDDSLEYGPLLAFSARKVYDDGGTEGLLRTLADEGHLSTLAGYAEDLVGRLAQQVRDDASVQAALNDLDDDETEDVVALATSVLLREAFGGDDDAD